MNTSYNISGGKMMINNKVFDKMEWSVVHDMENKLLIYIANIIKEYKVDTQRFDPDGIPLVYFGLERVTRVRKMTDKEYEDLFKEYYKDATFDIKLKYVKISDDVKV